MARAWLSTGVITGRLNQLAVSADGSAMSVSVATGQAQVEGFFYENDSALALTIATAHATLGRIDTVVVRLDRTANSATLVVVTGTAAASPVAPTLSATDSLYELPLANVQVDPAVGVITAGKVTDRRVFVKNLTEAAATAAYASKTVEGFRAYRSTAQALSAATSTKIVYDTEVFDEGADYNPATGEWTVPATGWYDVAAMVGFASIAVGERMLVWLHVNSVAHTRFGQMYPGAAGDGFVGGSAPLRLTAGDVVAIFALRGVAGNTAVGAEAIYFTGKRRI